MYTRAHLEHTAELCRSLRGPGSACAKYPRAPAPMFAASAVAVLAVGPVGPPCATVQRLQCECHLSQSAMDDFEALESAMRDGANQGDGAESQAGSGDIGSRASCAAGSAAAAPPAKKLRRIRGGLLSMASRSFENLGALVAAPSEGADDANLEGAEGEADMNAVCFGCGRSHASGRDWLAEDAPLMWCTTSGRGCWCKQCHTCWRTVFSSSHPLALFSKWISATPENAATWERNLIAYLSLSYEGSVGRITADMVTTRAGVLSWVMQMLGYSLRPCMVVPLTDVNQQSQRIDPAMLITILDGSNTKLGVLTPVGPDFVGSPDSFPRPQGVFDFLNWRSRLRTSLAADREILATKFNVALRPARFDENAMGDRPLESPKISKLGARFDTIVGNIIPVLQHFSTGDWEAVKESQLTSPVTKLSALRFECSNAGEGVILAKTDEWLNGVSAGKLFCRQYREFTRSRHKLHKLLECLESLGSFRKFSLEMGAFSFHPRLELLWLKAASGEPILQTPLGARSPLDGREKPRLFLGFLPPSHHVCHAARSAGLSVMSGPAAN